MEVLLSLPPKIKVLEAVGAVAGGRVKLISEREAEVKSSEGERTYTVLVDVDSRTVSSDDNGTTFRNYVGYPIIAVLMVKGLLPCDVTIGQALKDVKWKSLNEKLRSYRKVEEVIMEILRKNGIDPERVSRYVDEVMRVLSTMGLKKHA